MKEKNWKDIIVYGISENGQMALPLAGSLISAGFPSPADDFIEDYIDLNKELVRHPASTFYARVVGDSMVEFGIEESDLLVIDKAKKIENGCIAVCFIDGESTVKRLHITNEGITLVPGNSKYKPIEITEENRLIVWGVVTYIIKSAK